MRSLVAGGAGLIGSHLVDHLLGRGEEVVVLDNFLTGRLDNLAHRLDDRSLTVVRADLLRSLPSDIVQGGFDRIYHLASPASPVQYAAHPVETLLANSLGTRALLDLAAATHARFILASTSEVYGDPLVHPQIESYWGNVNPIGPRSCYDEGKRFAEALTMAYLRARGIDVRIARIFNTYGPRSDPHDGRVVPAFCVQALEGKPLTIFGDGRQTRSFCFVTELVDGLVRLADADRLRHRVVNLGNPTEFTIAELAGLVLELTDHRSPLVFQPIPVDDPVRRRPDITRATEQLGWEPTTPLREGLVATLDYFRAAELATDLERPATASAS